MARIVSLANQKGGVGKTTTTISLGAALAEQGQRVLLVDFDPQGAMSVGMGVDASDMDQTIYSLLLDRSASIDEVLTKTAVDGVEILPANIDLSAAEVVLVNEVAREQALKRVLEPLRAGYDFILVDCPPSLGLLTINALTASDTVIIPLECEFFSLRGVSLLVDTIDKVRDRLNPQLEVEGVVATMFDGRTIHSREVLDRVKEAFGDKVYRTTIPRTVRFAEAPVVGEPITKYAGDSKGAAAYRALAKEVLGIGDDEESHTAGSGNVLPADEASTGGDGTGQGDLLAAAGGDSNFDPSAADGVQAAASGPADLDRTSSERESGNSIYRQNDFETKRGVAEASKTFDDTSPSPSVDEWSPAAR